MRHRLFKMLLHKEGDPKPGGAPPTPEPQPQGAAPPVIVTVDQIKTVITETFTDLRNGLFGDLRKSGVLGKEKEPPPKTDDPPKSGAAAPAGLSMADVDKMLERDRVITRLATKHDLDDVVIGRMNRALRSENPDDVATWATSYLTDMKLLKGTEPNQTDAAKVAAAKQQGAPAGAPNMSDKGAPNGAPREFASIQSPSELTDGDIERLVKTKGEDEAFQMISDMADRWLSTVRIKLSPERPQE